MDRPQPIVVAGGSVAGLTAALALGRAGHRVTVVERDDVSPEADVEAAFAGERRGAPQAHQTHGLLARLRLVLERHFPDVLHALHEAGAYDLSTTKSLPDRRPDDDELAVLVVRRTTLEWVLRRAVLAEPSVEHRAGTAVTGLLVDDDAPVPVVRGVTVQGGGVLRGTVVAATGRRGDVPAWMAPFGVEIPEATSETGLVYLTRWYRLAPGNRTGSEARLGGDLGYVKYLAVPGDGDTLSATIAVRARDTELRAALADPVRFDAALARLPGPDQFFAGGPMTPIGPVRPMAGLVNRIRSFVDPAGAPRVLGFHAVGDAHTCTNPIYGRGCALALVQAVLLGQAFAAAPNNPVARAAQYEAACRREVEPWYDLSVQMDDAAREMARTGNAPVSNPLFTLFTRGGTDPVVGRGLLRVINLLARPEELLGDPELVQRAMAILAEPPLEDEAIAVGPTRDELLDSVAA